MQRTYRVEHEGEVKAYGLTKEEARAEARRLEDKRPLSPSAWIVPEVTR